MKSVLIRLCLIVSGSDACSNCGTSRSACDLSISGGLGACCYNCSH